MKIAIITLFPEMVSPTLSVSIIGRAVTDGIIELNTINLRDFARDKHKTVDDSPAGGGPGMVLKPDVVFSAVDYLMSPDAHVILLSPQGVPFNQQTARQLTEYMHIIMICGHYEGVDERVRQKAD